MTQQRATRPIRKRARSVIFMLPAWFSPTSSMRARFHRLRGVKISKNVEIGYFVTLDNLYPERITIEEGATITFGTVILAHDEARAYVRGGKEFLAEVHIGRKAFIGVNSVVMPGVTVGDSAIIGAGSVVTRDVCDNTTVVGVPARPLAK